MTELIIVVSPAFDRPGKRRHERFDVRLKNSDQVICEATRQPLLDASRIMLRRGFDPSIVICMVHSGASTAVAMRAPIGVAAQYDVMGSAFVRRKPTAGPMPSSGIQIVASGEPALPNNAETSAGASHNDAMNTTSISLPSPKPQSAPLPAIRLHSKGKTKAGVSGNSRRLKSPPTAE